MNFTWILKIVLAKEGSVGIDKQMGRGDGESEEKAN